MSRGRLRSPKLDPQVAFGMLDRFADAGGDPRKLTSEKLIELFGSGGGSHVLKLRDEWVARRVGPATTIEAQIATAVAAEVTARLEPLRQLVEANSRAVDQGLAEFRILLAFVSSVLDPPDEPIGSKRTQEEKAMSSRIAFRRLAEKHFARGSSDRSPVL